MFTTGDFNTYQSFFFGSQPVGERGFIVHTPLGSEGGMIPHESTVYFKNWQNTECKGHAINRHVITPNKSDGNGHKSISEFRKWAIKRWKNPKSSKLQSFFVDRPGLESGAREAIENNWLKILLWLKNANLNDKPVEFRHLVGEGRYTGMGIHKSNTHKLLKCRGIARKLKLVRHSGGAHLSGSEFDINNRPDLFFTIVSAYPTKPTFEK